MIKIIILRIIACITFFFYSGMYSQESAFCFSQLRQQRCAIKKRMVRSKKFWLAAVGIVLVTTGIVSILVVSLKRYLRSDGFTNDQEIDAEIINREKTVFAGKVPNMTSSNVKDSSQIIETILKHIVATIETENGQLYLVLTLGSRIKDQYDSQVFESDLINEKIGSKIEANYKLKYMIPKDMQRQE